jgi:hypothetical protein
VEDLKVLRTAAPFGVGLAVLAGSITAVFLSMRDVMEIGGSCGSGGPYVVAQPCPQGTGVLMVGGILGWFLGAGLTALYGSRLGGGYGALALLGWPGLFLSLGWNFLDYGLDPPNDAGFDRGADASLVFCAVLFFVMGGGPLLIGAKALPRLFWPDDDASASPDGRGGRTYRVRPRRRDREPSARARPTSSAVVPVTFVEVPLVAGGSPADHASDRAGEAPVDAPVEPPTDARPDADRADPPVDTPTDADRAGPPADARPGGRTNGSGTGRA